MSRTYRKIPNNRLFRKPKTTNYRRALIAFEEEIRDELGQNYLRGNFAKINTIPQAWDDLYIAGRSENPPIEIKYANLYRIKILGASKENNSWIDRHSIKFDKQKNVFRAWRCYGAKKQKVNYVPFVVRICKKQYPVKIKIDWWYD